MTERKHDFGKRKPQGAPSTPPIKRSGHVVLLLMGTLAVGAAASVLMSRQNCTPTSPGMAGPAVPPTDGSCSQRSSGGGGSGGSGGSHFYSSSDTSSSGRSSGGLAESGGVSRGGFGSFAHAFGFSGGG
jgi:hypothetical protein